MLRQISRVRRDASADAVHDLRVATRRLQEALDFFEPHLPARSRRRLSRRARRIRRELGPVRNADVALELVEGPERVPGRGASKALEDLRKRLREEAEALRRHPGAAGGIPVPGARKRCRFLAAAAAGEKSISLSRRAAVILKTRSAAVGRRIPPALGGNAVALHRLRIAVKRHRYALEILEQLGWPATKTRIAAARGIQNDLGRIHDLDMLMALIRRDLRRSAAGPLLRRLASQRRRRFAAFRETLARWGPGEPFPPPDRDTEAVP